MNNPPRRPIQFSLKLILLAFVPVAIVALLVGNYLRRPRPVPVPVTGNLTIDGMPAAGVLITFVPASADRHPATGLTDPTGSFKLRTAIGGSSFMDGAQPGSYVVTIIKAPAGGVSVLPTQFAAPSTSSLTAEVHTGPANIFTFDIVTE
jgi:hypothetical protein